jgi:uncharacterized membrane protein
VRSSGKAWLDRARSSLFLVPTVGVLLAAVLATVTTTIDHRLGTAADLPFGLTSTVESARSILSTVAGATITVAAISFSVSLLVLQQAATQYSPRVVSTLFRDPFNKRVMGIVVGTFTYCLLVLRSVRSALEQGGSPVVPNLSVAIAVLLGVATILAIVAFIDHSAHSMDVSRILDDVQREAIGQVHRAWTRADPQPSPTPPVASIDAVFEVGFDRDGWVQEVDLDALAAAVPAGAAMRLETASGRFAVAGTAIVSVSTVPDDRDAFCATVRGSVDVGSTRTMRQDVSFGLRQLGDVALRALSPGINDPTTAQDAIFHAAAVLAEILRYDPPTVHPAEGSGQLVLRQRPDPDSMTRLAFSETRRAASHRPAVCCYLLEAMWLVTSSVEEAGLGDRTRPLKEEARLVLLGCRSAGPLPADLGEVERCYDATFGSMESGRCRTTRPAPTSALTTEP